MDSGTRFLPIFSDSFLIILITREDQHRRCCRGYPRRPRLESAAEHFWSGRHDVQPELLDGPRHELVLGRPEAPVQNSPGERKSRHRRAPAEAVRLDGRADSRCSWQEGVEVGVSSCLCLRACVRAPRNHFLNFMLISVCIWTWLHGLQWQKATAWRTQTAARDYETYDGGVAEYMQRCN